MTDSELMMLAAKARLNAYTPYSHFKVGAALLSKDGQVFTGCNIENAAYSPTMCAERVAVGKAVSEGIQEFSALAVCGGAGEEPDDICTPCGVCRQVLTEFCPADFPLLLGKPTAFRRVLLSELLPGAFHLKPIE